MSVDGVSDSDWPAWGVAEEEVLCLKNAVNSVRGQVMSLINGPLVVTGVKRQWGGQCESIVTVSLMSTTYPGAKLVSKRTGFDLIDGKGVKLNRSLIRSRDTRTIHDKLLASDAGILGVDEARVHVKSCRSEDGPFLFFKCSTGAGIIRFRKELFFVEGSSGKVVRFTANGDDDADTVDSDWADDDGMTGDSIAKTPGEAAKIIAEAVEEFSSPEGGRLILSALTHVTDKIIADMIHLSKRRGMPDSEIGDLLFIRGPDDEKATWYGCRDGMWTVNGEGAISMAFEPLDRLEQAIRDANEKHGRFAKKLQPNINKLLTAIGRSQSRVAALKILSENMTYKSESKFDSNRGIIPFKNGYVADGAAKTIRKAVPKDLIRTTLDIPYVPELFESEYLQFLFEHHYWNVFSHRTDTGTFFLVYVRHAAFGNPGKKIFILYGDGNDGKSGLIVLFSEALSPLFGSLEPSILMTAGNKSQNAEGPKSELKRLAKLRCAMGSEAMSGSRWDVGSVKAITSGGDKKPVRGCYDKTPEDVVLNTLLVQAINPEELPAITRAESIRNRFLGINMLSKYVNPGEEDEDNHVFPIDQEFMSTAAKGLLRYAVVARIIKDQFASEDVSMPSVPRGVLAATEELFPPPKSESLTRSILSQCKFTGKIEDGVPYEKALQLADSGEKMMSKASVFGRLSNVFYRGFRPRASHDKYRYGKDMDKHGFPGWVVDASVAAATESENREFDIASIAKTMVDAYPDRFKYAFGHDGSAAGENREEKSAPVRTYTQAELDRIEASRLELIRFVEARRDDGGRDKLTREMRTPVYAMARMKENHDAAQEEIDFGEGMLM